MNGLIIGSLIFVSFLAGMLLVKYLTVAPIRMSLYLLLTITAMIGVVLLIITGREQDIKNWVMILLAAAFFFGGYSFQTRLFLNRDDPRAIPALTRSADDPGDGHTAVVYFTHGEPEIYDPIGWINQFNEFEEQKIPFVPFIAKPWFVFNLRNHYLIVGKSNHRGEHHNMLASIEQRFRDRGDDRTQFYISFLDDNPRPDAAVIQALNDGASRIVVAEVFLTISNHTAEGKHLIEELEVLENFNVPIAYTGPMWDSRRLREMFVERVNANRGAVPKEKVGILLVGHGQPDEWDVEWPTETEQEISFRETVLDDLVADGFLRENVSLAWMEFKEPKPKNKVEEFYKKGLELVCYFAAAISADAMHSQYDIPALMAKAKVPQDFPLINLGAWNNDPIVIDAIMEKIDRILNL
ncbi:MAG: hypothetical protein V2J07_04235 [Anaerolineae bacterium]|jgi:sirohydrochlorin ferrochelatase|nr:hypothetical protein [Anaerolineae bacterium]